MVGEAAGGDEAVTLAGALAPDVVLMDLRMPGMRRGHRDPGGCPRGARARVLVLTTYDTDTDVLPAIEAGATGYLLKDSPRTSCSGRSAPPRGARRCCRPSVADPAARLGAGGRRRSRCPPRELEVLELVARGATNREAAAALFISEATVKTHLLHMYAKLGVNDRAAAVAEAFERGLLCAAQAGVILLPQRRRPLDVS